MQIASIIVRQANHPKATVEYGCQVLTGRNWFFCLNFNYFAVVLFVVTLAVIVSVSLLYAKPNSELVQGKPIHKLNERASCGRLHLRMARSNALSTQNQSCAFFNPRAVRDAAQCVACCVMVIRLLMEEATVARKDCIWNSAYVSRKYWMAVAVSVMAILTVNSCLFIFR